MASSAVSDSAGPGGWNCGASASAVAPSTGSALRTSELWGI